MFNSKANNNSPKEYKSLEAKLETKKLRLREIKKKFENVCEDNANLKLRLNEFEKNYKDDSKYLDRERDLLNSLRLMENEKNKLEEKLNKIMSNDKVKSQEIELMNQKIRDFELILDENQNEYIESIKNLKIELESYKKRNIDFDKFIDILTYFFKKIQSFYGHKNVISTTFDSDNSKMIMDPKILQNKLIEIENFIVKITNENSHVSQKYSKVLDIQSKITQSEYLDNSQIHLETVKKLNEKIYDLNDENKYLKEEIEKNSFAKNFRPSGVIKVNKSKDQNKSINDEKDNIFTNNYINDNTILNEENNLKFKSDNFKTLEKRVKELEKELKIRETSVDACDHLMSINKSYKRSKSTNTLSHNNLKSNDNLIANKSGKTKRKKQKLKSNGINNKNTKIQKPGEIINPSLNNIKKSAKPLVVIKNKNLKTINKI